MLFLVYTTVITALEMRTLSHISTFGSQIKPKTSVYAALVHGKQQAKKAADPQKASDPPTVMDGINQMRAEVCASKPDPREHEECMKFMKEQCKPGGDNGVEGKAAQMNGEPGEVTTGKGFCSKFFPNEEKKKEEVKEEPKPKVEEHHEEEAKPIEKHEAHPPPSPDGMNLPEQGFKGPLVNHDDDTQVANWTKEYGPKGQEHDFEKICREHPENAWCKLKGYSTSGAFTAILTPLVAFLIL